MQRLSDVQRIGLVLLRTLIGWHFLYEGYYKLMLPAWSRDGQLLAPWSAGGYLKAASGPFASVFHAMASAAMAVWIDRLLPIALVAIGLSLILGFLTQLGGWSAVILLAMFYLAAIPTLGVPQTGAEGTYLIVNKNLVELGAVFVVLAFRTGRIAGLDLLFSARASRSVA
jgi:thiosulfate dehydrogenase [quinone] large subunit